MWSFFANYFIVARLINETVIKQQHKRRTLFMKMTSLKQTIRKSERTYLYILISSLFLVFVPVIGNGEDGNLIKAIRTTPSGIEIELCSIKPFPVRAQLAVLRIGSKEFARSRYSTDGNLNTLIFTLRTDEFAQLNTGDQVIVQYGYGELSSNRRDFGPLDKSMLDKF
jgi:hypothetical protein